MVAAAVLRECRRGKSGFKGQEGAGVTSGEGDFGDSATEINRMETCKGWKRRV